MANRHRKVTLTAWLPGFGPNEPDTLATSTPAEITQAQSATNPAQTVIDVETVNPRAFWKPMEIRSPKIPVKQRWPRLEANILSQLGGRISKYEANLAAIRLLNEFETTEQKPDPEQRSILQRFTGWGGLPICFNLESMDTGWSTRAQQLTECLSPEDYVSARSSVNNSHYTPINIIEAMWKAIQSFGFSGGRILEPAAGIGHFIGAIPSALIETSQITAIEIDRIAGRILKKLYGSYAVDVRIELFEKAALVNDWFDLVIGNVPFGQYKVADTTNRPYGRFNIHNYFLGRALDLVRPGGLVCLITSCYTLDSSADQARHYLSSQADLIAAIRLPKGAFSELASTDVQTDILFLRKRPQGKTTDVSWTKLAPLPDSLRHPQCYTSHLFISAWYAQHPELCIGKIQLVGNGYEAVPTAVYEGDIGVALDRCLATLPVDVYQAALEVVRPLAPIPAAPEARPGSFEIHQGRIHRVEGRQLTDLTGKLNATQRARISGMITIRNHARSILDRQLDDTPESTLNRLRLVLNHAYEHFVARYGCLSTRANALAFRRDPDYPLLLSLEHYDEESGTAAKAAIFSQRTVSRVNAPAFASEPAEALAISTLWRGCVDIGYMAELLSASEPAVIQALQDDGQIFLDPESLHWQTADEYLSGNVRRKLSQALAAGSEFSRNLHALAKVQPEDIPAGSIVPALGAVWIPAGEIEAFIHETFDLESCEVGYLAQAGTWSIRYPSYLARQNIKVTQEFGTGRMNALDLVQCALNVQIPTIKDRDPYSDKMNVNAKETLAAREKLGLIKERFAHWAFEASDRRSRLCAIYNDRFNAIRARQFDGTHLKLPGFSRCFELHPHQKNAIWRVIQTGNTGLFHVVGAGKTAVCVASSMELRRLGFLNKPCHVVPNHMLEQYTAEFVRMYPSASVLMASKEDLEGDKRRELVSRIATGNWDAIVITHSSFERIRMSPHFSETFMQEAIGEIEMAIRAEKQNDRSSRIVKQLEAMKKNWMVRLERLLADKKKDDVLTWEQLGIDGLFVDEAHLYKNLYRFTKMTRVAGLPLSNSERAFDLYLKTRYTMQLHKGAHRGIVFATATPVANTMAEIHTMMRYLQPNRLKELGLQQFDAWAATFGENVTALEIAPDGSGYRMHTRFARFINVPELMGIFGEVADIRTAEMLKLPIPKLKGGKARIIACPASAELKAFVEILVERSAAIRNGTVQPTVDNMLAITTDGRKAALDFRLISPGAKFDSHGKIHACVHETVEIWQRTAHFKGTQLIFCDLSSPKEGKCFSVYDDLRLRLIDAGIPATEIAFVHTADTDTKKAALFKAVREGRTRILLGSTQKMGVGTNVQRLLSALHHLDAPWRPCDVEQREGRILRQGSLCEEVEILRYVTEGSFDAYLWQTLETKARFMTQVMKGDQGIRSLEDVELAALSYAEVKALASGNPMVIEKAGVDAEILKLSTLFSMWRNQRYNNENEVDRLPQTIASLEKKVELHSVDLSQLEPQTLVSVRVQLGKRIVSGAEAVGDELRGIIRDAREALRTAARPIDRVIGRFGGLDLGIFAMRGTETPNLYLAGQSTYHAEPYQTGPSLVSTLLATLASIERLRAETLIKLELQRKRFEDIQRELARSFEHEGRLTSLLIRQRELMAALDLDKHAAEIADLDNEAGKEAA